MAIEPQLDTLEAKGLIRLAAHQPELEYLFRHWLVQDAAYGSLLKQERRELHRLVGDALETLYPERRAELAAVLAMHFDEAGDVDKAVEYLVAAGKYALERNAIKEAFTAFDRAAVLLAPSSEGEDDAAVRKRLEIAIGRARAGLSFRSADEVSSDLEGYVPAAERLGDPEVLAAIHLSLALTRLLGGEDAAALAVRRSLDRVTQIADQLEDPSLAALPLALIGLQEVFSGPIREGVAKLEEGVPLLERRQDFIGAAFARGALAIGYATLGEFDKAERAARNAGELAANGDLIAQLDALIAESIVRSERGQLDEAVPLAQTCLARAEETGATACIVPSAWVLGDVYQRQGRFREAREVLARGHEVALVVDRKVWRPTLQAWLGSTRVALGDEAPAADWEEALATARGIGNRVGEAGILWQRGEAAARRGDHRSAVADLAAGAAIAEELGARPELARVLRSWGRSLRTIGDVAGDEKLRRAVGLFDELGITREAEELRAELGGGPGARP